MNTLNIIISISLVLLVSSAFAQGPPPQTPIDGGLSLLLLAGGAYGAKKLFDKKRES